MNEITPAELAALGDTATIIDVREQGEYDQAHVAASTLIPMSEFVARIDEVPHGERLYILCASGVRSAQVAQYLEQQGFDAMNVAGGINAWQSGGLPVERG
ncbi:MAG: sulfurtransferase [Cryobacterium sp.]|nr:sulfurtransferase [Cryobacterium sp.]